MTRPDQMAAASLESHPISNRQPDRAQGISSRWPARLIVTLIRLLERGATLTAIGALRFYKLAISPLLPKACRYLPSCSAYAEEVFRRHGPVWGLALTLGRLARCHPFATGDVHNPAPETPSLRALFGTSASDASGDATSATPLGRTAVRRDQPA